MQTTHAVVLRGPFTNLQLFAARRRWGARRGNVFAYTAVSLAALTAVLSLVVDFGRARMVKTELQVAADAAARAGAPQVSVSSTAVRTLAKEVASQNNADGYAVTLTNADIVRGTWDSTTQIFTGGTASPNAVQVTAVRAKSRGTAMPLTLMRALGGTSIDIYAHATAMYTAAVNDTNHQITAKSNPWLAGMPAGTIANNPNPHNNPDYANGTTGHSSAWASPQQITALPLVAGTALNFASINGSANNDPSGGLYTPDGNLGWMVTNQNGDENGISSMTCPIIAVVGIFLDDTQPDSTPVNTYSSTDLTTKCPTDYSSAASRDWTSYQPKLKQPFFIGDGQTSSGQIQNFVIPQGATRLYIGTMDGYEWNNNVGYYYTTITRPQSVALVKTR